MSTHELDDGRMLPTQAKGGSRVRLVWWVCLGLMLVLGCLVAYQIYSNRVRRSFDPDLLGRLGAQTLAPADAAGPLEGKAWTQWRGPRRDGATTAPDLLTKWPEGGPPVLWRVKGGDGYSSFAVRDGRAYTMLAEDGNQAVVALDVATGEEKWRQLCGTSSGGDHGSYGGPRSTPALDGDRVYVVTSWGVVQCLDAKTGDVIWRVGMVQELDGRVPRWGYATSPLVEGGLVYVMPGGKDAGLAALDRDTGKVKWSGQGDLASYSSPIAATIGGQRQIVYLTGTRLVGVEPQTGRLLWEYKWADQFNVNAATPVLVRAKEGTADVEYLFISSGYQRGCTLVKVSKLSEGEFSAQRVYESNELCCHFGSPVLHGGELYAGDEKRDLTCLDVRTGEVKWRVATRAALFQKASILRVDGRLLVLGEQGQLALVQCNGAEFEQVARCRPFKGRCWTMPVLADGRLPLRDQKEFVCMDLRAR